MLNYEIYDECYAEVIEVKYGGVILKLDNGECAIAHGFTLESGGKVICEIIGKMAGKITLQARISSVVEYAECEYVKEKHYEFEMCA